MLGISLAQLFRWLALGSATAIYASTNAVLAQTACPKPVLDRLTRHRITAGETLESIARKYNVIPATLLGMNPNLRQEGFPVGAEIVVPPYNGIAVEVAPGTTWRELAERHGARADVMFEANGCQPPAEIVFIPGVNWTPNQPASPADNVLTGYPLAQPASTQMSYGWQLHPIRKVVVFHSGIDFDATIGTPVLSVGEGVVAFAGDRGNYGKLVVINHASGRQTRYAHLESLRVETGQRIRQGDTIGTVGTTGEPDSDQPHLHFEIRYNSELGWIAEDPNPYFRPPARSEDASFTNPSQVPAR
ncbi:MAG: LysM peptidoglycan-binding domain-containing M23 family metallopeptidase [Microcoleaceae cyanobacterium]